MASLYLTREVAREAVEIVLPAIMELMESRASRSHLHIVVLDPTVRPWNGTFEDAVLYEYGIGNTTEWEHDYRGVARSKAKQSWRTGLPNGQMQTAAAVLIEEGDIKYTSSYMDPISGMIVGCSGVQGYFDYLVGGWVALACLQLAYHKSEDVRQDSEQDQYS